MTAAARCCVAPRALTRLLTLCAQDVPSLGSAGDIVDVSPGHARNYLVPGRMAVPVRAPGRGRGAAAQAAAQAEESAAAPRAAAAGKDDPARALEEAQEAVRRLTVAPLVRAGAARLPSWLANPDRAAPALAQVMRVLVDAATGQPRAGVSAKQLLAAVRARKHVALPAECLRLDAPLAELGEHAVPLRFDAQQLPGEHTLTVLVKKKL